MVVRIAQLDIILHQLEPAVVQVVDLERGLMQGQAVAQTVEMDITIQIVSVHQLQLALRAQLDIILLQLVLAVV